MNYKINGVEIDFQETKSAGVIMLAILITFLIVIIYSIIN
jgi:hypothetical protein